MKKKPSPLASRRYIYLSLRNYYAVHLHSAPFLVKTRLGSSDMNKSLFSFVCCLINTIRLLKYLQLI